MNEFLTSVASYLASAGFGTIGSTLRISQLPSSTPYVCTAVFLTGGPDGGGRPVRSRGIEIVHRNTHIESANCVVNSLHGTFDDKWNLLSAYPGRFVCDSEPGFFGYDANNMPVFSLDLTFTSIK